MKKLKKVLSIGICLAVSMSLIACEEKKKNEVTTEVSAITEVAVETTEEATNLDSHSDSINSDFTSYDMVIESYKNVFNTANDYVEYEANNMSILFMSFSNPAKETGYMIKDINNDGVDELIIGQIEDKTGWEGIIFSAFTMKDGKVVQLFTSHERNRFFLTDEGHFVNQTSSSAFESAIYEYEIKDGELSFVKGNLATLDENEQVAYYSVDSDNWDPSEGQLISEEENEGMYQNYIGSYVVPELTPFN